MNRIATRIISTRWHQGDPSPDISSDYWGAICEFAGSWLAKEADHAERDIIRKGKLPKGHRVIKRHKAIARNGKVRG